MSLRIRLGNFRLVLLVGIPARDSVAPMWCVLRDDGFAYFYARGPFPIPYVDLLVYKSRRP